MAKKEVPNSNNGATRANPFQNNQAGKATAYLADVQGLGMACDAILGEGCAIVFSRTRDGGALVVTILDDDQRHRTYCSNQVELDRAIESIGYAYIDPNAPI